jgi:peptidyl-prolyl cis-trans isomerase B (cyclophilin B)
MSRLHGLRPLVIALMVAAALPAFGSAQPPNHNGPGGDPVGWRPCAYLPAPPDAVWGPGKNVGTPPQQARLAPADVMTLVTNRGTIKIKMLTAAAPCTVNSFRFLASKKYFDGTHCHRLTTSGIYVLQCGDPSATGSGHPGYEYQDENLVGATYTAGTVAMANAGPSTNGSQFFITYKNSSISPLYTPFGVVLGNGLDIVRRVAEDRSDNSNGSGDGHPRRSVIFKTVRLTNA